MSRSEQAEDWSGAKLHTPKVPGIEVGDVLEISPDGKLLATILDKTILVWRLT